MNLTHPVYQQRRQARGAVAGSPGLDEVPPGPMSAAELAPTGAERATASVADETETLLLQLLRLLRRSETGEQLSAVDKALLVGARTIFQELIQACDQKLGTEAGPAPAKPARAPRTPRTPKTPK